MDNSNFDSEDHEILVGDIVMLERSILAKKTKTYYLYKTSELGKNFFYR